MEQLRVMQATILHMVRSAQIGCTTPASEYNLFIYLLLLSFTDLFFGLIFLDYTTDALARFCTHASLFFTQPVDHLLTYLARLFLMAFDDVNTSSQRQKKLSVDREGEKRRAAEEVYTRTTPLSSLRVCFLALFISASAGDCKESRTRGIHV
jgi:hypothetical protein